jgi:hypothetical protein
MNLHVEGLWQGHGQRRQGLLFGLPGGINGGARYRAKQTIALVENPLIRRGLKVGDGRKTFILTHEQVLHIVAAALDFAFVLRRADTTRIYNETELLGIGCIALIERSASTGALSNPGLEIVNPHARRHAAEPKNRTVMAIKPRGHVPADAPYHCPHPAMANKQWLWSSANICERRRSPPFTIVVTASRVLSYKIDCGTPSKNSNADTWPSENASAVSAG